MSRLYGVSRVLPTLNEEAMEMSYLVARSLNCRLGTHTTFDRKNYFYPDMPKNYQISQFHSPVGEKGYLELELGGVSRKIGIHDVHLEEDAGKMIHERGHSYLDYNRAGLPARDCNRTRSDKRSGGGGVYPGVSSPGAISRCLRRHMEEGSLKCDANVSINEKGKGLGTKAR